MITKQATSLKEALEKRGLECKSEYSDGHKHVDICIPKAKLYIEINGLQHYTDPKQIMSDFNREHYSDKDGFATLPITNQLIDNYLDEVANAIVVVAKKRGVI